MKGLYIMQKEFIDLVYPADVKEEIGSLVTMVSKPLTAQEVKENTAILNDVDVIFSGWGGLKFTEEILDAAPNLKAVFYAAGSIKSIVSDAFWERDIIITTANVANGMPVAEFTLSQIFFTLKGGWNFVRDLRTTKKYPSKPFHHIAGGFNSTVGLISLSTIGKEVVKMLQSFDVKVLAYDPFASEADAKAINVELCSLDDIFERSDVVSLHTPLLPETTGMITGDHFEKMKAHASFINTARGAIVKQDDMLDILTRREDITAILDVVYPEPPPQESPLFELPNVILTPHIAGSEGPECGRMGAFMRDELKRYLKGEALNYRVTKKAFDVMA